MYYKLGKSDLTYLYPIQGYFELSEKNHSTYSFNIHTSLQDAYGIIPFKFIHLFLFDFPRTCFELDIWTFRASVKLKLQLSDTAQYDMGMTTICDWSIRAL